MNLSNIIVYAFFAYMAVGSYIIYTSDKRLEKRVKKLDQKLKEIDTIKTGTQNNIFTTSCTEHQLYDLEERTNELIFCCQCPLYLNKVQQDKQQRFPMPQQQEK